MPSQYDDFLFWLGQAESGDINNPNAITASEQYRARNSFGYIGKYQMGEAMLHDLGYYSYTNDMSRGRNDWKGRWTGKRNIHSLEDFFNSPDAQEFIVREEMRELWKRIKLQKLSDFIGKEINGIVITESGLLAAAHNQGVGQDRGRENTSRGLVAYLRYGIVGTDGNKNPITRYLTLFADFQTPFDLNPFSSHHDREIEDYFRTGKEPLLDNPFPESLHPRTIPESYIWHTQGDEKVRLSHTPRNNKEFNWNSPPLDGHPGDAYGCRCWAESIFAQDYSITLKEKNMRYFKKAFGYSEHLKQLKRQRQPIFWSAMTHKAKQLFKEACDADKKTR